MMVIFIGDADSNTLDCHMTEIQSNKKGWEYKGVNCLHGLQEEIIGHLPRIKIVVLLDGSTRVGLHYPTLYADFLIKQVRVMKADISIVSAFTNPTLNEELKSRHNVVAELPPNLASRLNELAKQY